MVVSTLIRPSIAIALLVAANASVHAQEGAQPSASEPERGLRLCEEGAFDGFTLFAPLRSGTVHLIDMDGEVVHRWETGHKAYSLHLLPEGRLLYNSHIDENPVFFGGGIAGRIREIDWDGKVLWETLITDENQCQHHDIELLPNGNVLAIVWERVPREEALALGRDPEACDPKGIWPDAVLELEPTRPSGHRVVWEWHAKDHWIQDQDPSKPGFGSIAEHPGRIDLNADARDARDLSEEERAKQEELEKEMSALGYGGDDEDEDEEDDGAPKKAINPDCMHVNSVDYNAEHDLVLLSSPRLHEVFVIDHSTTSEEARGSSGGRRGRGGELLWRWGNPEKHGAGSAADRRLYGQHDAHWIPAGRPGEGSVLLFNNGSKRPEKEFSSIEQLPLPFDPERGFLGEPGKPYGPETPEWSYAAPESFYSFFISGCQRLPNGNTLICSGAQGRFFEVTSDGKIVWEYWNPHGGELQSSFGRAAPKDNPPPKVEPKAVFRATRIARDDPRLAGRKLGE